MEITVGDLVDKIKNVFDTTKVMSVETIYENNGDNLKMIISLNKILYNDINIIYNKLIFFVNTEKSLLDKNYFSYLFDINCEYVRVEFEDLVEFEEKIKEIFNKNKFGDNIKIISDFIKSPTTLINLWFSKNDIKDLSIISIDLEKIPIVSCDKLEFNFTIETNNNQEIKLTIKKTNSIVYSFDFSGEIFEDSKQDFNSLVETIGSNLKNKIK